MPGVLSVPPQTCRDCAKKSSDGAVDGYSERWYCNECLKYPDGIPKEKLLLADRCTPGYLASLVNQLGRDYYGAPLAPYPYLVPKERKHVRSNRRQFYAEILEMSTELGVTVNTRILEAGSDSEEVNLEDKATRSRSRERESLKAREGSGGFSNGPRSEERTSSAASTGVRLSAEVCHNCGELGHFVRDCPKPREPNIALCFRCSNY